MFADIKSVCLHITSHYCFSALILISVRLWNFTDGGSEKGNHCIMRIRGAPVRQKLGTILENKVVQKLKLEKKRSPKTIFLNDFFF